MRIKEFGLVSMDSKQKPSKVNRQGGAISIVCSTNNGYRVVLSRTLVEALDIDGEVWVAKADYYIMIASKPFCDQASRFFLRPDSNGKRVIYCKSLAIELVEVLELDFDDKVSNTVYEYDFEEDEETGIKYAIIGATFEEGK